MAELANRFERLASDLRELIRKSDWNNRHEERGAEQDAWLRGLHTLAGSPDAVLAQPVAQEIDPSSRSTLLAESLRRAWRKVRPPKPVSLDLAGIKLEAALQRPGCVICTMAADSIRRWLFMLLWEGVMDPEVRERIRAADGFCSAHWWQLHKVERMELHSVGGVAILAEDILGSLAEQLRANRIPAGPGTGACPACRSYRRGEDAALSGTCRHLERPEFRVAYFAGHGTCAVHRGALAARVGSRSS
jgi:hypothetical protein